MYQLVTVVEISQVLLLLCAWIMQILITNIDKTMGVAALTCTPMSTTTILHNSK